MGVPMAILLPPTHTWPGSGRLKWDCTQSSSPQGCLCAKHSSSCFTHSNSQHSLTGKDHPHFTDGEIETQKCSGTCPKSTMRKGQTEGMNPGNLAPGSMLSTTGTCLPQEEKAALSPFPVKFCDACEPQQCVGAPGRRR